MRISRLLGAATTLLAMFSTRGAGALLPLVVLNLSNLGFVQVLATTTSGTVTLSPSGGRTRSGGAFLGNGLGVSAAAFTIIDAPFASYSITLPSSCTLAAGGSSMTANGSTSSPSGTGNLGLLGTQTVTLGATLHVGPGQAAAAAYSGTYSVTLAYN
jgi:hypothetical protein